MADSVFSDLLLVDGDLPIRPVFTSGETLTLQRLKIRLGTFYGEFVLDNRVGLDFLGWSAATEPDVAVIGAVVQTTIKTTPGVASIDSFSAVFVRAHRRIDFTCSITLTTGATAIGRGTVPGIGQDGQGWVWLLVRSAQIMG